MTKTRITHISLGTHVGGMEKLLVEFARFADRSRHELAFVCLQERGPIAEELESFDWPVVAMNKSSGVKPEIVWKLARTIKQFDPHVVHTHNTAGFIYGVAAAALARVPKIIHTRHGQRFEAPRRQTLMIRALARWVDHFVSVSKDGQGLSIVDGVAKHKSITIPNGVDLMRFAPVSQHAEGRAVCVARLSPEKDIGSLLRAMHLIKNQLPDNVSPLTLDVIGDGVERSSLESLSASLGLTDRVYFHGSRSDIPSLIADASLFVLPSITEGISLTLLEAMASGLPVVACDVGGNPEVVIHDHTGILIPARDPQALADAMIRIHRDPSLARRYGSAGRLRVETKFCIRNMVRTYESLYQSGRAA